MRGVLYLPFRAAFHAAGFHVLLNLGWAHRIQHAHVWQLYAQNDWGVAIRYVTFSHTRLGTSVKA